MAADFTITPSDYVELPAQTFELIDFKFSMSPGTYTELIDTSGGGGGPTRPASGFLYPRGDQ